MKDNIRHNKMKESFIIETKAENDELIQYRNDPFLLIDQGYEYVENGDYDNAFKLFSLGASLDNSDTEILNGLGITLYEMGKITESRIVLERAIRLDPEDAITYANLAGSCWEQEDYEKAIYYYTKSIEKDAELEESHYNLINCYIEMGASFMALIACKKFLDLFPDNPEGEELLFEIILNLGISMV